MSNKTYRGINLVLLSAANYGSPYWLTLRQADQVGGSVRKSEHGEVIVFWKVDRVADSETKNHAEKQKPAGSASASFSGTFAPGILSGAICRKGVIDKLPKIETHQDDPIDAADRIIARMPNSPEIRYAGSKAFYSPITNRITTPPRELFASTEEIYASVFHEALHVSGHRSRLNRESITDAAPFGSPIYAAEELIAEMGSRFFV